ncbi:hypothetical protein OG196_14085 [Kitasatospora purpeofusca]|uniref:hypothetical protein n=1 Tax=Kitasatospora purpeofusca TaxID=67352 RepID=UPI002E1417EC|nr:hypothetical protein OG196_14085 [Kitasatospora purpeofusca]
MNPQQADIGQELRALLIAEDGTATPVTLPGGLRTENAVQTAIAQHLGGPSQLDPCAPECAPDIHFATVGLLEHPPAGAPRNEAATAVVETLRHVTLAEPVRGPALVMGPAADGGVPTSLDPGRQRAIQVFVATWLTLLA